MLARKAHIDERSLMPHVSWAVSARPVDLRVPADLAYLPILRAVPESLAIMIDLDIDRVSDLGLAIDQVCAELIRDAAADASLELRALAREADLRVTVTTTTKTNDVPDRAGFGWRVLTTLMEVVAVDHAPGSDGGWRTCVDLRLSWRQP